MITLKSHLLLTLDFHYLVLNILIFLESGYTEKTSTSLTSSILHSQTVTFSELKLEV